MEAGRRQHGCAADRRGYLATAVIGAAGESAADLQRRWGPLGAPLKVTVLTDEAPGAKCAGTDCGSGVPLRRQLGGG